MATNNASRYNPALLRLELLSCGIRVDPEFSKQLGGMLKEPLWTRTGPTSTGIDLMLEKNHYVSPAIEGERFTYHYKNSPFLLTVDDQKKPVIQKNEKVIQRVRPFPRPSYYGKKTSSGVPMEKIGVVTGDFLAIAIDNRCWFWGFYRDEELVNYQSYAGVTLTPRGKKLAKKCMDRHRLLAALFEMIGVEGEQAEVDAAEVGHHISPATMSQLRKLLEFVQGNPKDPPWIDCFTYYCKTGERIKCPGVKGNK